VPGHRRTAPFKLTTTFRRPVSVPSRGSARLGADAGTVPDFPLPFALNIAAAPPTVAPAGVRCGPHQRRLQAFPQAAGAGPAARRVRHIRQSNGGTMGNDEIGFFDTGRAATYLGLSRRTLDGYRVSGGGPAFHRFGNRVRYRRPDLDAWAARRRATTTAEADRLAAR